MRRFVVPTLIMLGLAACSGGAEQGGSTEEAAAANESTFVPPDTRSASAEPEDRNLATPATLEAPVLRDDWVGRWVGVEGLNLTISKAGKPGRYSLRMQYGTDEGTSGTFDGLGTPEGIAFTRTDGPQVLRASTGDQTGLKYLAGKSDCLKVKDGEGYCRK